MRSTAALPAPAMTRRWDPSRGTSSESSDLGRSLTGEEEICRKARIPLLLSPSIKAGFQVKKRSVRSKPAFAVDHGVNSGEALVAIKSPGPNRTVEFQASPFAVRA